MNPAKAIELATLETLRRFADGAGVATWRAWQSLPESKPGGDFDRAYPCVDLRASPPSLDANGVTNTCLVQILCITKVDDDENHARCSAIYDAVQGVCDNLYKQALNSTTPVSGDGATANAIGVFDARLATELPILSRGGFSFSDGLAPFDEDGLNQIGITLVVHFSRSDF